MFPNRLIAGQLLADALSTFKNKEGAIVVAIPNGGIMTGFSVAKKLELPLELELVKKIRHPEHQDKVIGAVSLNGNEFDENSGVTSAFFENDAKTFKEFLLRKHELFLGNRATHSLTNKTVILVDDGIKSGNTIALALRLIKKKQPLQIIVAIPVAPEAVVIKLKNVVDHVICLHYLLPNETLKDHYRQFKPVKDATVIRLLRS